MHFISTSRGIFLNKAYNGNVYDYLQLDQPYEDIFDDIECPLTCNIWDLKPTLNFE